MLTGNHSASISDCDVSVMTVDESSRDGSICIRNGSNVTLLEGRFRPFHPSITDGERGRSRQPYDVTTILDSIAQSLSSSLTYADVPSLF